MGDNGGLREAAIWLETADVFPPGAAGPGPPEEFSFELKPSGPADFLPFTFKEEPNNPVTVYDCTLLFAAKHATTPVLSGQVVNVAGSTFSGRTVVDYSEDVFPWSSPTSSISDNDERTAQPKPLENTTVAPLSEETVSVQADSFLPPIQAAPAPLTAVQPYPVSKDGFFSPHRSPLEHSEVRRNVDSAVADGTPLPLNIESSGAEDGEIWEPTLPTPPISPTPPTPPIQAYRVDSPRRKHKSKTPDHSPKRHPATVRSESPEIPPHDWVYKSIVRPLGAPKPKLDDKLNVILAKARSKQYDPRLVKDNLTTTRIANGEVIPTHKPPLKKLLPKKPPPVRVAIGAQGNEPKDPQSHGRRIAHTAAPLEPGSAIRPAVQPVQPVQSVQSVQLVQSVRSPVVIPPYVPPPSRTMSTFVGQSSPITPWSSAGFSSVSPPPLPEADIPSVWSSISSTTFVNPIPGHGHTVPPVSSQVLRDLQFSPVKVVPSPSARRDCAAPPPPPPPPPSPPLPLPLAVVSDAAHARFPPPDVTSAEQPGRIRVAPYQGSGAAVRLPPKPSLPNAFVLTPLTVPPSIADTPSLAAVPRPYHDTLPSPPPAQPPSTRAPRLGVGFSATELSYSAYPAPVASSSRSIPAIDGSSLVPRGDVKQASGGGATSASGGGSSAAGGGSSAAAVVGQMPARYSLGKFHVEVLSGLLDRAVEATVSSAQRGEFTWNVEGERLNMYPSVDDYFREMLRFIHKTVMQQLQKKLVDFSFRNLDDGEKQGEVAREEVKITPEEKGKFFRIKVKSPTSYFKTFGYCDIVIVKISSPPSGTFGPSETAPLYIFASVCDPPNALKSSSSGYEMILLMDIKYHDFVAKTRRFSIVLIDKLYFLQRRLKGLLSLHACPLASALASLAPQLFTDAQQPSLQECPAMLQPFLVNLNPSQRQAVYNAVHAVLFDQRPRVCAIQGGPGTGKMWVAVSILKTILNRSAKARILFVVPNEALVKNTIREMCKTWQKQFFEDPPNGLLYLLAGGNMEKGSDALTMRSLANKVKPLAESEKTIIERQIAEKQEEEQQTNDVGTKKRLQHRVEALRAELAALKPASSRSFKAAYEIVMKDLSVLVTSCHSIYDKANELQYFYDKQLSDFDCVIMYHAGRTAEVDGLLALTRSRISKAVIIGDHMEVSVGEGNKESKGPLSTTYLHRIHRAYDTSRDKLADLTIQYTMPREILSYPNCKFYLDIMKTEGSADSAIRNAPFHQYRFIDLAEEWVKPGSREAEREGRDDFKRVADLMVELVRQDTQKKSVTKGRHCILVRKDEDCLRFREHPRLKDIYSVEVEVSTVAEFQGRDRPVVLFYAGCDDLAGQESQCDVESRRICTAITVATESLFVVGHGTSLKVNKAWFSLIQDAKERKAHVGVFETSKSADIVRNKLLRDEPGRGFTRRY